MDIVLIATPDHWHALPTVMACQAGKDIYVEKPLATEMDKLVRAVDAVKAAGTVVQVGTQLRSLPSIAGAREVVAITPIFRGEPGWTLGVQRRRGATDDEWDRAWRLPGVLGAGPVRSRTFVGDAAAWTTLDWRRGVAGTIA